MKNQYSIIPSKLFSIQFHFLNLLAYFIFFGCGISVGILYSNYGRSLSLNLRVSQFSFSALPPPAPLLPPVPVQDNPLPGKNNSSPLPEQDNPLPGKNNSSPLPEQDNPLPGKNNSSPLPVQDNPLPGKNNSSPLPVQDNPFPGKNNSSPLPVQDNLLPEQPVVANPPAQELPLPLPEQPIVPNPAAEEMPEQPIKATQPEKGNPLPSPVHPEVATSPAKEPLLDPSLLPSPSSGIERNEDGDGDDSRDDDPSRIGLTEFLKQPPAMHDMNDRELMWRARLVSKVQEIPVKLVPKVAFMFLVKGPILLAPLWEQFFQGNEGLYSIYVHSDPSFNASDLVDSVFHGRRIPSKKVGWGKVNMVEAELRLLANALLDVSNERFVLLSEACIPLFNFPTIYSYLMNSTKTFIEIYDQPGPVGRGRYNDKMMPNITLEMWRKGSQWFEVDRELAIYIISDQIYFPAFQKYCHGACYADEHYLQTYVHIKYPLKNADRSLTWVDWTRGGPHPSKYIRTDVTFEFLEKLRFGYTCEYNGQNTNICFLFARKFLPHSLERLVKYAPKIMQFHMHKP